MAWELLYIDTYSVSSTKLKDLGDAVAVAKYVPLNFTTFVLINIKIVKYKQIRGSSYLIMMLLLRE